MIIIDKENHSFDNLFGRFPGADGTTTAELADGKLIHLLHAPDHTLLDIGHAGDSAAFAVDGGRMDRFAELPGAIQDGQDIADSQYDQSDIPAYWAYAEHYALADHFFSTIMGPSFPNHLVTIAASSANTIDNPRGNTLHAWGCDSGPFTVVSAVDPHTGRPYLTKPRFDIPTMADTLQQHHVSWKYYAPQAFASGYIWSSFDAIRHIRYSNLWKTNVPPDTSFIKDVQDGKLPAVSWLVTNAEQSEHPPYSMCVGENWTVDQINAVMRSKYWPSTLIVLTWDDFGGFYDPAKLSDYRMGDRIFATATPDQSHALLYGADTVHDLDLVRFGPTMGQVVGIGQERNDIEVRFGKRTLLVDLVKSTRISRRNGKKGSVADVAPGVAVVVTGILNTRLDEIVRVNSIKVGTLPHGGGKPRP